MDVAGGWPSGLEDGDAAVRRAAARAGGGDLVVAAAAGPHGVPAVRAAREQRDRQAAAHAVRRRLGRRADGEGFCGSRLLERERGRHAAGRLLRLHRRRHRPRRPERPGHQQGLEVLHRAGPVQVAQRAQGRQARRLGHLRDAGRLVHARGHSGLRRGQAAVPRGAGDHGGRADAHHALLRPGGQLGLLPARAVRRAPRAGGLVRPQGLCRRGGRPEHERGDRHRLEPRRGRLGARELRHPLRRHELPRREGRVRHVLCARRARDDAVGTAPELCGRQHPGLDRGPAPAADRRVPHRLVPLG